MNNSNIKALFELLRSGLWEKDISLLPLRELDFSAILEMAEEQGVVGLVATGLEAYYGYETSQEDCSSIHRTGYTA